MPWIILGDFNVTLSSSKHSRPYDYTVDQTGIRNFQEAVADCGISDLIYTGPELTWWNKRELDPIGKKLDRALVNASWRTKFPQAHAMFESNSISDHTICCVFTSTPPTTRKIPFKLFNFIVNHPRFLEAVIEVWHSSPTIFTLDMHSTGSIRNWSCLNQYFGHWIKITMEILQRDQKRHMKPSVQNRLRHFPSSESFAAVTVASETWHHLQPFRQKSWITWQNHGDQNTSFSTVNSNKELHTMLSVN